MTEKTNVAFSEQQFARFMRLVVGLWSSKQTGVEFEPSKASLVLGMLNDRVIFPDDENVLSLRVSKYFLFSGHLWTPLIMIVYTEDTLCSLDSNLRGK